MDHYIDLSREVDLLMKNQGMRAYLTGSGVCVTMPAYAEDIFQ